MAKNGPAKSEWLFGDDLNKRINTKSSTNTAVTASSCPYYPYDKYLGSKTGSNQQHWFKKLPNFPEGLYSREEVVNKAEQQIPQKLDNVSSKNVVHSNFGAGNIKHFYENWKKIRNDHIILSIIQYSFKINFTEKPQNHNEPKIPHDMLKTEIITQEVKKLLNKGVIAECSRETGDFVSTIFTRQKKDGTFKTILSLKYLNEFAQYQHFKMESLLDVFKIIKPNAWMASADLKDAFFMVPTHESHQKYFKFERTDKVYKFVGMLNGCSDAMQKFTKILRTVYANVRQKSHLSVVFVDDSYLQGDTETECLGNVEATTALLE